VWNPDTGAELATLEVRPGIIQVIWSVLPCFRSTLWSFTPNEVDDTGPYLILMRRSGVTRRCTYFLVIHTK
jgi:hypothetical protein